MKDQVHFDKYAENYDAALNQGLSATGEGKEYFADARIEWVARCVTDLSERPRRIMDYGCGDGSSSEHLLTVLKAESLIGVDTSEKSLELATQNCAAKNCSFLPIAEYSPNNGLDLVYCNGVFHHIPLTERTQALDYIWRSLRSGGLFALWENNPWNPGTRYVMARIPFDRDAITLTALEAQDFVRRGGFEVLRTDSLFFFPRRLKWLRWMEPYLSALPLGGQYLVLCRKS
jgi:SAM-dependent methyltransferase